MGYEVSEHANTVNGRRHRLLSYLGVDLVIDVGANRGQYAKQLRFDGYRGRIVSVEPASAPFEALRAAAADDAEWEVVRAGIGAESGAMRLNISGRDLFNSFRQLTAMTERTDPRSRYVTSEEVEVRRLDDLVAGRGDRLAIKMDVQGFEREVLAGGEESLRRAVFAEVETGVHPQYDDAMLFGETLERLSEFGLSLAAVENILTERATGRSLAFNGLFVRTADMPA
jgi:FkbM family methyltransferase